MSSHLEREWERKSEIGNEKDKEWETELVLDNKKIETWDLELEIGRTETIYMNVQVSVNICSWATAYHFMYISHYLNLFPLYKSPSVFPSYFHSLEMKTKGENAIETSYSMHLI